ncbi:DUF3795 domain-containing protein [bacterium]|nr:DUF3795 domain-containing protein [bacterium]
MMKFRYDTVCGLYCGACKAVMANQTGTVEALAQEWEIKPAELVCHGCKTETIAAFCQDCTFRECVNNKGLEYCFQCSEFPCDELVQFRNDKAPHHSVVLHNSKRMRDMGVPRWLEEQRIRWSCPECGTSFSWYDQTCSTCGAKLYDCRAEEAELDRD